MQLCMHKQYHFVGDGDKLGFFKFTTISKSERLDLFTIFREFGMIKLSEVWFSNNEQKLPETHSWKEWLLQYS